MNRIFIGLFLFTLTLGNVPAVQALELSVQGSVVRSLVADADRWGGCMVELDVNIPGSCPDRWVSFSCDGTYTTKDVAYRMFDIALMASALNKQIKVWVDTTKLLNGYCYVNRIDVIQ